ncbi:MAG: MurR/RpiR family transcriptional regulator [Aerococcus sp.]|nr:MurR/RpiR family transcriptional regulator [Aerococcus sp.]
MDVIAAIEANYALLSKTEQHLALYVIEKGSELANTGIKELANQTQASSATISRFVRKLGFKNYEHFKLALAKDPKQSPPLLGGVSSPVMAESIQVFNTYQAVIKEAQASLDKEMMQRLLDSIQSAERIFIYGMGSSGLSATEFSQRLMRMGLTTFVACDDHMMTIYNHILHKEDLVIGISSEGETVEVNQSLKMAKQNGAKTAAITCNRTGHIIQLVDYPLITGMHLQITEFINSQFPLMYVIDVLSTLLLEDKRYRWNIERTISAIYAIKTNDDREH